MSRKSFLYPHKTSLLALRPQLVTTGKEIRQLTLLRQ
jgi:hypothetical protein